MGRRGPGSIAAFVLLAIGIVAQLAIPASAAKPVTTLTFDELPVQPVDGLEFRGVEFGFEVGGAPSMDAWYAGSGPGTIAFVQDPSLEGDASGVLTLRFRRPTTVLRFGVALNTTLPLSPGVIVTLFGPTGRLRRSVDLDTTTPVSFTEGEFIYRGPAIRRAVVTFDSASAARFALDNLTFKRQEPPGQAG